MIITCLIKTYNGLFWWNCGDIKARPLFAEDFSELIKVTVALPDAKLAFSVIALHFVADVICLFNGPLN